MKEEKTIVIDLRLSRGVVTSLVGVLIAAALLSFFMTGERSVASSRQVSPAQSEGMRQFYLGNGGLGSQAESCETGYHLASLWEIADPSNLKYNTTLGQTSSDSGQGPPTILRGWLRTGYTNQDETTTPGRANCDGWTIWHPSRYGTVAQLPDNWTSGAQDMGVWQLSVSECDDPRPSWCIED